jgi:hypothetical protein
MGFTLAAQNMWQFMIHQKRRSIKICGEREMTSKDRLLASRFCTFGKNLKGDSDAATIHFSVDEIL